MRALGHERPVAGWHYAPAGTLGLPPVADVQVTSPAPGNGRLIYSVFRYMVTRMIKSFRCRDTEALANDQPVKRFKAIERADRRKLEMIAAAGKLVDLKVPPGNRLEALKGDRKGQHSIRINDKWRVCFHWNDGAEDVEIVDYH